ncbi:MAG: TolC family protein [Sandaracinaceae bacterium]
MKALRVTAALLALSSLALAAPAEAQRGRRPEPALRVRFLIDGEYSAMLGFREQILSELRSLLSGRRDLDVDPERDRIGDYTLPTAERQLGELMDDGETDLVIALGAMSGIAVGAREELAHPVIVPYTLAPNLAGLPLEAGHSGRENLAYITDGLDLENGLRRFREVVPYSQVHVLLSQSTEAAAPGLSDAIGALSEEIGADVTPLAVDSTLASDVMEAIPEDATAMFLSPLVRLGDGEVRRLLTLSRERQLPVFAFGGRRVCELGALGSVTSEADLVRRARRTASFVERWLDGDDLSGFDVSFAPTEVLYLNLETANLTGARPTFILLTEAELVGNVRPQRGPALTLARALREAVARNPDLAAADASVESAEQAVDRARAPLLPSASVSATGALIDEDRAAGFGSPGQFSASWTAQASQLIYSPRAWGGFEVEQHSRDATEAGRDATRLDVILEAGEAYANTLRATAGLRIQRENLALTRANLQRARLRVRVGRSSEAEITRWEASLATSQRDVLQSFSQLRSAEIELNRVLNRPLGDPVRLREADADPLTLLAAPDGAPADAELARYLDNPWSLRVLTDFLANEAAENAPELREIASGLSAQRRALDMSEQVLYLPEVALSASLTNNFLDVGGVNPRQDLMIMGLVPLDPFDFQVGLQVTFPIYSGGERYANLRQSRAEISRLQYQRRSIELRVEQGVRSTMATIAPAYANIELSRRAAAAAARNRELVDAAYLAGSVDILRVLDAQTQAVTARVAAANAVYDLMLLLLQVERRAGRYRFFASVEERADFLERLARFSASHRMTAPVRNPRTEAQP